MLGRAHGQRYACVSLSGAGRPYVENHVVFRICLYQLSLVFALGAYRFAVDVVDYYVFVLLVVRLASFGYVDYVGFAQHVVLCAAAYERLYRVFKLCNVCLVAHNLDYVVAGYYAQLRIQRLNHPQVRVVRPV